MSSVVIVLLKSYDGMIFWKPFFLNNLKYFAENVKWVMNLWRPDVSWNHHWYMTNCKRTLIDGTDHLWDIFIMKNRRENQVLCNEPTVSLVAQNVFFLPGEWCVVHPSLWNLVKFKEMGWILIYKDDQAFVFRHHDDENLNGNYAILSFLLMLGTK